MAIPPAPEPSWTPPRDDECEESDEFTIPLGDPAQNRDRLKLRMKTHRDTCHLVEFALIQQTYDRGGWVSVAVVDSSHGDEVHFHQYGRRNGERIGGPEHLVAVACLDDIQTGYDLGYERIFPRWAENRARWHDG